MDGPAAQKTTALPKMRALYSTLVCPFQHYPGSRYYKQKYGEFSRYIHDETVLEIMVVDVNTKKQHEVKGQLFNLRIPKDQHVLPSTDTIAS